MKSKKEQIKEMAQCICGAKDSDICQNGCSKACGDWKYAERAIAAGYRKASDVIDEFVGRLKAKESPKLLTWEYGEGYSDCIKIAEQIAAEMRQEVENEE